MESPKYVSHGNKSVQRFMNNRKRNSTIMTLYFHRLRLKWKYLTLKKYLTMKILYYWNILKKLAVFWILAIFKWFYWRKPPCTLISILIFERCKDVLDVIVQVLVYRVPQWWSSRNRYIEIKRNLTRKAEIYEFNLCLNYNMSTWRQRT